MVDNCVAISAAYGFTVKQELVIDYGSKLHDMTPGYYPMDLLGCGLMIKEVLGVKLVYSVLEKKRAYKAFAGFKPYRKLELTANLDQTER